MRFTSFIISFCLIYSGCATIPAPMPHEYSEQRKMQAAQHWEVLARDIANKINNELIRNDFINASVYVKKTCGSEAAPCDEYETSQFDEGFRDLLVTQLVNYGIPTHTEVERDVIVINYKVQVVLHGKGRIAKPPTGVLTGLTAAVSVFSNASAELLALTIAGGYDAYNAFSIMQSDYEVIITTSMVSKKRYIYRSSDIYYINDSDSGHYRKTYTNKSQEIELTGSNSQPYMTENTQPEERSTPEMLSIPTPQLKQDI